MNMKCTHAHEWPADEVTCEWRIPPTAEHPQGLLVQWCPLCGALREVAGTAIGAWSVPVHVESLERVGNELERARQLLEQLLKGERDG